jgi:hypothetical protein
VWVAKQRIIHQRVSLYEVIDMRRFTVVAVLALSAAAAKAQDTTVVVVRHIPAQQDTSVVVRHLAPPPPQRLAPPYAAPRYALRSAAVIAKDPRLGSMLSFIFPGGGQYYAGAEAKGLALTLLGIGAPIVGFASVNRDNGRYNGYGCGVYNGPSGVYGGGPCRNRSDYTPAVIGLGVGITAWLYGVATAGTDVQHWNQAHGVRFVTAPGRAGFAVALP